MNCIESTKSQVTPNFDLPVDKFSDWPGYFLLGNDEYSAWCTQRYHFYNSGLALILAIDHGANRDAYGSLECTMLLSAHTHRIGVTSVLAHSTAASFFSF